LHVNPPRPAPADLYAACVCLGVNRAARGITRRYDEALKPLGLTSGQFSILSALAQEAPVSLGTVARLLGMDRTTLNRNLKPLVEGGLVAVGAGAADRRVRGLSLTAAGSTLVDSALPHWQAAQRDSRRRLGDAHWPELRAVLASLA